MKFLDSDFIISALRGLTQTQSVIEELDGEEIATTIVNEFEVLHGAHYKQNRELENATQKFFSKMRVFEFNSNAAEIAARISAQLKRQGRELDAMDLFIASIVLANNGTLVTRNKKHFERIPGLEIEEW